MIEGESLLNDGTAMVMFSVFLDIASGKDKTSGDIAADFFILTLGGIGWGIAFALLTIF